MGILSHYVNLVIRRIHRKDTEFGVIASNNLSAATISTFGLSNVYLSRLSGFPFLYL
jgi:hypothetical protein